MAVFLIFAVLAYWDRAHDPCAPEWDRSLYEWRFCDKPEVREPRT